VDPGPDRQPHTNDDLISSFSTAAFSSFDPEGIAYDRTRNRLFVVDATAEEVFIIQAGANAVFDGVPPLGDDQVTSFDVTNLGLFEPQGIEFNPHNSLLYILSGRSKLIAETTTDGELLKYVDISGIGARIAAGLAYAPSSADPTIWNFYVVDRGVDNNTDPDANDGKLIEISFPTSIGVRPVDIFMPLLNIR
jgi:DNA-binding beta-propeller fold protein YncE